MEPTTTNTQLGQTAIAALLERHLPGQTFEEDAQWITDHTLELVRIGAAFDDCRAKAISTQEHAAQWETWATDEDNQEYDIWRGICLGVTRVTSSKGGALFKIGLWIPNFDKMETLEGPEDARQLWLETREDPDAFSETGELYANGIKESYVAFHSHTELDTPRQIREAAKAHTGKHVRAFKTMRKHESRYVNHIHRVELLDDWEEPEADTTPKGRPKAKPKTAAKPTAKAVSRTKPKARPQPEPDGNPDPDEMTAAGLRRWMSKQLGLNRGQMNDLLDEFNWPDCSTIADADAALAYADFVDALDSGDDRMPI